VTQAPDAPDVPAVSEDRDGPSPRRVFVKLVMAGTGLLFVLMLAAVYYRWVTEPIPTSVITIQGTKDMAGAQVTVTFSPPDPNVRPLTATIDAAHSYGATFYLQPGVYKAIITQDDRQTHAADFVLGPKRLARWDLTPKPATDPSANAKGDRQPR
jgi:hypothetical protein